MSIPIIQFWHPRRPHIDYAEMPMIKSVRVRDGEPLGGFLDRIIAHWEACDKPQGLVCLEQSIAIDLRHIREVADMAHLYPSHVITVPYLVWPVSTGRSAPIWCHAWTDPVGNRVAIPDHRPPGSMADWFGLGFTYLPSGLLEACPLPAERWDYRALDMHLSILAKTLGILCHVTRTEAIHLHW